MGINSTNTGTTVVPPTAGVGNTTLSQDVWAAFLISQINAQGGSVPYTLNNVQNIERWMAAEEPTNNWWNRNNPLNASLGTSASDGTGSYKNLSQGANYTAAMIMQNNMSGILKALEANASPVNFAAAVERSPWASSHYGVAAAGAPSNYVVAGRGLDYIANIPLAAAIGPGTIAKFLPADAGAAIPANPAPGIGGAIAGLATGGTSSNIPNPISGVDSFFTALGNGFGLGWAGIFTIILGSLMIIVGLVFIFRKQAVKIGEAAVAA